MDRMTLGMVMLWLIGCGGPTPRFNNNSQDARQPDAAKDAAVGDDADFDVGSESYGESEDDDAAQTLPPKAPPAPGLPSEASPVVDAPTGDACDALGPAETDGRHRYFVTTDGKPDGDGSRERPWDLKSALGAGKLNPGDELMLRRGTYSGTFVSELVGSDTKRINIKACPAERVTLDAIGLGSPLTIRGMYTSWWGLELTNSGGKRTTSQSGSFPSDLGRADGVATQASHTRLYNLVIHDNAQGMFIGSAVEDLEVVGCIIYFNGWSGPDRGHGHGIYAQNKTGKKLFADNIIFSNFGWGFQLYGSDQAFLRNMELSGNVVFNAGVIGAAPNAYPNLWVSGGSPAAQIVLRGNHTWHVNANSTHQQLGGDSPNTDVTIEDNVLFGFTRIQSWQSSRVQRNVFYGQTTLVEGILLPGSTHSWDNNQYHSPAARPFTLLNPGRTFDAAGWRQATGFDAASTVQVTMPAAPLVAVRKNPGDSRRGHIVVHNFNRQAEVSVNLTNVVPVGRRYVIRDAQNYFGDAVMSGVNATGVVTLRMEARPVASPVGTSAPSHTGVPFGAFVVEITD